MLELHARERVVVITARGDWDLLTAPALGHLLGAATSGYWPVVVVDLGGVAFMDAAGAAPLRTAAADCREKHLGLFLVQPPAIVDQVLRVCGLDEYVVPLEQLPYPRDSSALPRTTSEIPARF